MVDHVDSSERNGGRNVLKIERKRKKRKKKKKLKKSTAPKKKKKMKGTKVLKNIGNNEQTKKNFL